jgi:hypothetical protein
MHSLPLRALSALLRHTARLKGFTQKIEVSWWMIVLLGVIDLVATLLTISTQSALTKPVRFCATKTFKDA